MCVACWVGVAGDAVVMGVLCAAEQQASVWVLVRDRQRRGVHSLGRGRRVCECAGWCVGVWLHRSLWRRACVKWWCGGVAWLELCTCACSHLYACALLQDGGAMLVSGASSVTVSGGSTITSSTAQVVRQQRGCQSVSVCVHVCVIVCW